MNSENAVNRFLFEAIKKRLFAPKKLAIINLGIMSRRCIKRRVDLNRKDLIS